MDQKDNLSSIELEPSSAKTTRRLGQTIAPGPLRPLLWMLVGLTMVIFTWHACTRMVAAGDTWVAMACGRHFINHGVDTVEPFSANSHHAGPTLEEIKSWPEWAKLMVKAEPEEIDLDLEKVSRLKRALIPSFSLETIRKWHPTGWVNQNWLTHVIFYGLTTRMGSEEEPFFNALVYWKFALYALTMLAIFAIGRQLGVHPLIAALAASMALFAGRSFLDVRPAGFSNLLVPTLILIWILATYRNILWIWLMIPVAVFWSNVHGGYIYVFIMMIPFIGLHLLAALPKRWSIWLYHSLGWIVLFMITCKGIKIEGVEGSTFSRQIFLLIFVAAGAGLVLTCIETQSVNRVLGYHAAVSAVLFFVLLARYNSNNVIPLHVVGPALDMMKQELGKARLQYVLLFFAFLALGAVLIFGKPHLKTLKVGQVGHLIGAYVVTLVAAIVFNPFHLTNLTHTFIISVSENAARWRMVHEWHPAFEWSNPVGTAWPFLIIFLVGIIVPVVWLVSFFMARQVREAVPVSDRGQEGYALFKLDLPLVIVTFLTIYMAYRSRRFIPIASFVACPVLALLLQNSVELWFSTLTTLRNKHKWVAKEHWRLEPLYVVVILGLLASIGFIAFVKHFKHIDDNWFWGGTARTQIVIQVIAVALWVATVVTGGLLAMGRVTHLKQKVGMLLGVGVVPLAIAVSLIKFGGPAGNQVVLYIALVGLVFLSVLMITREMTLQTQAALARQAGQEPPKGSFHRLGVFILVGFFLLAGSRVAIKYNNVYLKPWPQDPDYYSVFMRMTASHLKPFEACQFIRDNKLSGNMLNYWTEGGFIAYGQTPDPNDGKTPLQLFMDGRAQAAYERKTFDLWSSIWAGGPPMMEVGQIRARAKYANRGLTQDEKKRIEKLNVESSRWVVKELRKHDVWVALVPKLQFDSNFARALGAQADWPVVYIDDKQKLFVDVRTEQGEKIFKGISTGETVFPNEYTRMMNLGFHKMTYLRKFPQERREGLEYAIKAFEMKPCDISAILLVNRGARYADLKQEVATYAVDFVEELSENLAEHKKHNGYNGYLEAGWRFSSFLSQYYQSIGHKPDDPVVLQLLEQAEGFIEEIRSLSDKRRW